MMQAVKNVLLLCSALLGLSSPWLAVAADDGATIVDEVCSQCHTPKRNPLDKVHLTKEQWSEALERMVGYGAEIPKDKIPELLDYLVRTKGPAALAADPAKK